MVPKYDDIWPFDDRRLAIQTTVFLAWILTLSSRLKIQSSDRNCQYSIAYTSVIISHMELKLVNSSYSRQLFQNLRPKLQNSKNRIFVTSHFGTLLLMVV